MISLLIPMESEQFLSPHAQVIIIAGISISNQTFITYQVSMFSNNMLNKFEIKGAMTIDTTNGWQVHRLIIKSLEVNMNVLMKANNCRHGFISKLFYAYYTNNYYYK